MLVTQLDNICFCDYWFCATTKTPAIVSLYYKGWSKKRNPRHVHFV